MKNSIIYSLFCFLLLNISTSFGQRALTIAEQNSLKEKVQQTALKTETIVSDFIQKKQLSILDDAIESKGKLHYKNTFVRWEYTEPSKNIAIFKNDKLLVDNEGIKNEINLKSNKIFRSLNELIVNSIKGNMFDDSQFNITYFENEKGYQANFAPKDKRLKRFVASFVLTFTRTTGEVTQVKLIEPNDDYTLITFKNRKTNVVVTDDKFKL